MLRLARVTPATVDVLRVLLETRDATWGLRLVGETGRPAGSVYPILARLEQGGWVSSHWDEGEQRGPRRRLYELTAQGRVAASHLVDADLERRAATMRGRTSPQRPGLA